MKAYFGFQGQSDGPSGRLFGEARAHVFVVPELFDLIMIQLDQRTLLTRVQQVCRSWKTQIEKSTILQQALFYRVDNPVIFQQHHAPRDFPVRNSLLAELFTGWFDLYNSGPVYRYLPPKKQFHNQPFHNGFSSHPTASWRNMLVQQKPAVNKIGMLWQTGDHSGNLWIAAKIFTVANGDGLRMGNYYDIAALQENDRDCPMACWPSDEITTHTTKGNFDARKTFLECLQNHYLPSDHYRRSEVEEQKRRIVFEADIIFATPFDVGETPKARKREWDGKFRKGQRVSNTKEWDLAPLRDGFMAEFLGVDGTMGAEIKCGLQEIYAWRAKIEGGFDVGAWAADMHTTIFD